MPTRTGTAEKRPAQEHDRGYKRLFSHPETVEELLLGFVEEDWVHDLDFSTLERIDHGFVGDDLGGRACDVVWRVHWREGGESPPVYLLLELQSTSYHFMAVRLLTYLSLLQEQIIRTERLRPRDLLPIVLPILLHTGMVAWRAPVRLSSLFPSLPKGLRQRLPRLDYLLLDVNCLDLDRPGLAGNRLAAAFRIEACRTPEELPRLAKALALVVPRQREPELRQSYNVWFRSVARRAFKGAIIPEDLDLEDTSMLEQAAREWEKRFLKEGREEGREEGRKEGRKEGQVDGMRRLLLKLLDERFGPLPEMVRRKVEAIDSARALETLGKRVLAAKSLDDMRIGHSSRSRNGKAPAS